MHIEGSLSPSLLFRLAEKNNIDLPSPATDEAYTSIDTLEARYKAFTSLDDFLAYYNRASAVLIRQSDFEELAYAYMKQASEDGIVHAEVFFDLQTHTERGVGVDTVVLGLDQGLKKGEQEFGISFRLIMCVLRHLPVQHSVQHVDLALPFYQSNHIHGLGMCSTERSQPPSKFLPVFERAREVGITRFTAHAGEEGPAGYITEAIDLLGVERIDHGVRSVEDEEVLRMLKEKEMLLTVCPLSNVALRVVEDVSEVPLRKLLDAGVKVSGLVRTISSPFAESFASSTVFDQFRRPSLLWWISSRQLPRRSICVQVHSIRMAYDLFKRDSRELDIDRAKGRVG